MAINPEPPVLGLINYDYRRGADFVPPAHLIKRGPSRGVDPSMVPEIQVDTTYDENEILANQPTPRVLPVFIGLRTALATRSIERANNRLQDLSRLHRVSRHIGHSILAGRSYMDAETAGQPNLNRPSSREELRTARKLDKISTRRRRAGSRIYATSLSSTPPVSASWAESREAHKNAREHDKTRANVDKYNDRFRAVIRNPAEKAASITARRNRAVAKREALDQAFARRDIRRQRRVEKIRQMRNDVKGSAHALSEEIIERHYESWDMTREQAERLAKASARAGKLVLDETVATTQTAVKGGKYTTEFYAEVARGAADIYWRAAKYATRQSARGAHGAVTKTKSTIKRKNSRQ